MKKITTLIVLAMTLAIASTTLIAGGLGSLCQSENINDDQAALENTPPPSSIRFDSSSHYVHSNSSSSLPPMPLTTKSADIDILEESKNTRIDEDSDILINDIEQSKKHQSAVESFLSTPYGFIKTYRESTAAPSQSNTKTSEDRKNIIVDCINNNYKIIKQLMAQSNEYTYLLKELTSLNKKLEILCIKKDELSPISYENFKFIDKKYNTLLLDFNQKRAALNRSDNQFTSFTIHNEKVANTELDVFINENQILIKSVEEARNNLKPTLKLYTNYKNALIQKDKISEEIKSTRRAISHAQEKLGQVNKKIMPSNKEAFVGEPYEYIIKSLKSDTISNALTTVRTLSRASQKEAAFVLTNQEYKLIKNQILTKNAEFLSYYRSINGNKSSNLNHDREVEALVEYFEEFIFELKQESTAASAYSDARFKVFKKQNEKRSQK